MLGVIRDQSSSDYGRINKAYLYVKNLTNTWYYNAGQPDKPSDLPVLDAPVNIPADVNITIANVDAGTYIVERWSTRPEDMNMSQPHLGLLKGILTIGPLQDGSNLVFNLNWDEDNNNNPLPLYGTGNYDWAYKIYKMP